VISFMNKTLNLKLTVSSPSDCEHTTVCNRVCTVYAARQAHAVVHRLDSRSSVLLQWLQCLHFNKDESGFDNRFLGSNLFHCS